MAKFIKPFTVGDTVKYTGNSKFWNKGELHIIHECDVRGVNEYEYSTNKGAWFNHKDFEFISPVSKESVTQLLKDSDDDDEEGL